MSELEVDPAELASITTGLNQAADGLDALAGTVPSGIDAGPMTGVIAAMLSQVVDSAANVSVALSFTAGNVAICREYYERADATAAADFATISEVMES